MIDKRPDIESERPDFERNALSRGLSVDRNDTGSYLMAVSEYRWRGWKERARIAAEREREILDLLREAADFVHLECLGKYGKAGHTDLCRKITEALAKREERTNDANG